VLSIHKGADATLFLLFRDAMQREGRFTRAFWTVNFNNPAFGDATNAKRDIKTQGAC